MRRRALLTCLLAAISAPVHGAFIQGQVTSTASGTGIVGVEVRAYSLTTKGWQVAATLLTGSSGNYSLSLPVGVYLVQAAPADITTQCLLTQRYYDSSAPFGGGFVQEAADPISLATAGSVVTGINIAMATGGAFDGRVTQGGFGVNGSQVRVEQTGDPRVHVETTTSDIGGIGGSFSACGLTPGSYRFWIHQPNSQLEDLVVSGPFLAVGGSRQSLGTFTATLIGNDSNEPNPSTITSTSVPPFITSWTSTGALIVPRGTDADYFCLDAVAGDRYLITTSTTTLIAGEERASPWVDPLLGWFSAAPLALLAVHDDDPTLPGPLNARLEAPVVPADGRYCVAVTTFGDVDFNGSGQASAGRYAVRIERDELVFANGFE